MKHFSTLLLLLCMTVSVFAQENRYLEEVFDEVTVEYDIVYGENWDVNNAGSTDLIELKMDMYYPEGDEMTDRPFIILHHAGSYLDPFLFTPLGDKSDPYLVEMATQWAKRGWVVAVPNYRLGWLPFSGSQVTRGRTIMQAVYRAIQDMKTCVRFMRKEVAENNNPWGINPDKVVASGSNSGGYNAINAPYFDMESELFLPKFLDDFGQPFVSLDTLGNFDGTGGIDGYHNSQYTEYSSDFNMVFSLGGAVADLSWINENDVPCIGLHGLANEGTAGLECAIVLVSGTGDPVVEVCGTGRAIQDLIEKNANYGDLYNAEFTDPISVLAEQKAPGLGNMFYPCSGAGFEPWGYYSCDYPSSEDSGDPNAMYCGSSSNIGNNEFVAAPYIDTLMQFFAPRAMVLLQLEGYEDFVPTAIEDFSKTSKLEIFPNPSSSIISIETATDNLIEKIEVFESTGKLVKTFESINNSFFTLNKNDFASGIFMVKIVSDKGISTQKVVFE